MAKTSRLTELLERAAALSAIVSAVEATRTGGRQLLMIEAPPGIGKTALLGVASEQLAAAGVTVFSAAASEIETTLSYGVVRQLFARFAAPHGEPVWDGPAQLARSVVDPYHGGTAELEPGAAMHGLLWLCASLAARGPIALIVDDAHWADASSLHWLSYLARRTRELPVLILVSRRTAGDGYAAEKLLAELARDADLITLAPLSEGSTAQLVRRMVGSAVPDDICTACFAATAGNPFFVHELIAEGGATLASVPGEAIVAMARDGIARSVVRRLEALGIRATQLARAVSVLGIYVGLRQAAALADLDYETAEAIADQLTAASIFLDRRPLQFTHPIVRTAVYDELAHGARSVLHRRAAHQLNDDGADPTIVGSALLPSEPHDDAWTCARLRDAASAARGRGDLQSAAVYLERALREPPRAADRADVLLELGIAERHVLAPGAVEHLREAWQLAVQPERRGRIAFELTRALSRPEDLDEARELIGRTLPALTRRPALAALLETNRIGLASLHLTGQPADITTAAALIARLGTTDRAARLLRGVAAADALYRGASLAELRPMLDAALQGEVAELAGDVDMSTYLSFAAMLCERFDEAGGLLAAALDKAQRAGSPFAAGHVWCFRSHLFLRLGRVTDAEADARQAMDALDGYHLAPIVPLPVAALIELDQPDEALALLQRSGGAGELPPWLPGLVMTIGRIPLWVAVGEHDKALADLATAQRLVTTAGFQGCAALAWRIEGALACLAVGDQERAQALADEQVQLAEAFGASGVLGAALRVAGIVHADAHLLSAAVETLAPTAMQLERAKALAALGGAQRRAGHRSAARDTLRQALDLADACGAAAVGKGARAELRVAGARPRRDRLTGPGALTASEQRISALAVQNATNLEIAQALFLTSKTVEHHLTNIYAKLGIRSRTQLSNALSSGEPPEAG